MKTYEKPRLLAISLTANESLCACAIDVVGDNMDPNVRFQLELAGWLKDGKVLPTVFTEDKNCEDVLEGYCKMGPSGEFVFNS